MKWVNLRDCALQFQPAKQLCIRSHDDEERKGQPNRG
jgi:hypothetical protein